jgi:hypothetical protein
MQQIPFADFLNQLYMFRAINSPLRQGHILTVYTTLIQGTDIDACQQ